jgi:hypothetical protein
MLKLRQRLSLRFLMKRNYKLSPYLDAAYKAANNKFEKDFIETDKK